MTAKMTITSSRLTRCGANLVAQNKLAPDYWCCIKALERYIEVPKAEIYWLEASNQQWKDRSGTAAQIQARFYCPLQFAYRTNAIRRWSPLYPAITRSLVRLGADVRGGIKTIYFRLLYKESGYDE